jgi:branched-chain amino acid transport system ATP-binding protein
VSGQPLLQVTGLSVGYGRLLVVRDVSLEVREGEVVALIGPNGAGKTTLVSAIAGLLTPAAGQVRFAGQDITGWPAYRVLEQGLGLVPQGRQLFGDMTVLDNLLLGSFSRRARPYRRETLEAMFQRFPILRERKQQQAGQMSGGEQQMLAIARALMARPRLLVLDEPSLGLAPKIVEEVADIVREVSREGTSVLLVEQNVPMALGVAARVYVLEAGEVADQGTPEQLMQRQSIREAYLGI